MRCESRALMLQGSPKSGRGASLAATLGRPPWPWPELRSPIDPTWFHSDDFPEDISYTSFSYTFHLACCYGSSQRKLWPSSNSQNPSGANILPGFPLLLAQPRAAWEDRGEVVVRDSQKCHMHGRTPGPLPNGPLLVACLWVHGMDWGRKGKQTHESGGVGSVGCEIIWQTSRISKESFVSGIWNSNFFHSQHFCD